MTDSASKTLDANDLDWCRSRLAGMALQGFAIFGGPDQRLLAASSELAGFCGCAPEALQGRALPELLTRSSADTNEWSLRRCDGSIQSVTVSRRDETTPGGSAVTLMTVSVASPMADVRAQLMTRAFEQSAEAIFVTDAQNVIVEINASFTRMTGYSREEIIGKTPKVLSSGRTTREQYREMWLELAEHGSWQGEIWDQRKDGSVYPKWLTISSMVDESGKLSHYIASFSDLTERKSAAERLSHLAHHDPLTDLLNRAALERQLGITIASARRDNSIAGVLLVDMDRFKDINDTLGHHIGDGLLVQIAERLKECVRASDVVARLGGDEFVIVLQDIENPMAVAGVASKIRRNLADPYHVDGHTLYSTPSIGVSLFPHDGPTPEILIRNADAAMYHAKSSGRNNFQFFDHSMNVASSERLRLETMLRQALAVTTLDNAPQFQLYFQPQLHLETGRIIGLEALARWIHPEHGFIPPAQFIPIAEETGLIQPLGDWVFWEACRHVRKFKDAGFDGLRVAVNLSCQQLRHEGLPIVIHGALACYDLQPKDLELEITESTAMQNPAATIGILEQLNDMGIALAIDDFGTGYSSLSYLKDLPIQRLKLDRSFVKDIDIDRDDEAICSATIVLGHNLGLDLVAEGVETESQRDYLRRLGCDVLQGFLYSKPLPASEMITFLQNWKNQKPASA